MNELTQIQLLGKSSVRFQQLLLVGLVTKEVGQVEGKLLDLGDKHELCVDAFHQTQLGFVFLRLRV